MNKIYKRMLAAAGSLALFAAVPAVSNAAPTVDQLTAPNMQYYAVTWGAYTMGNCVQYINTPIKIEKVSDTEVILRNFYLESDTKTHDLRFSYDPATGKLSVPDKTWLYKSGTTNRSELKIVGTTSGWIYLSNYSAWFPHNSYSPITGTFTEMTNEPGAYQADLGCYGIETEMDSWGNFGYEYFERVRIVAYPAEYAVTDIKHTGNDTGKKREYKVGINFKEDGKHFNIINFTNEGCGYDNYNWDNQGAYTRSNIFIDGVLNDDGTVTLGNSDPYRYAFTWDQYKVYRDRYDNLYGYNNVKRYNYAGFPNGYSNSTNSTTVNGTWGRDANPYHLNYGNGWVKSVNGGTCETKVGFNLNLDPYGFVINGGSTRFNEWYENTNISGGGKDVTFDADITQVSIAHDPANDYREELDPVSGQMVKKGFYRVKVKMGNFVNKDNVDYVDLYCIEGSHTHCGTVSHADGVGYIGSVGVSAPAASLGEFPVYPSIIRDAEGNPVYENGKVKVNKDLTFYLKAHYKTSASSAPGEKTAAPLESTFHALTTRTANDITTAVDLSEATGLNVEDVDGGIIVHAEGNAAVQVYNMGGMLVAAGNTNETIAIDATGVLLVRVSDKVFKIMK